MERFISKTPGVECDVSVPEQLHHNKKRNVLMFVISSSRAYTKLAKITVI